MGIFRRRGPDLDSSDADDFALEAEVEVLFRVLAAGSGKGDVYWGAPSRCPECGVYGFVDDVDHASGVTTNRCLSNDCQTQWVISRRALREVRRRLAAGTGPVQTEAGRGVEGSTPIPTDSPLFTAGGPTGSRISWGASEPEEERDPLDRFTEILPDPPRIDPEARADADAADEAEDAADRAIRRRFGGHRIA